MHRDVPLRHRPLREPASVSAWHGHPGRSHRLFLTHPAWKVSRSVAGQLAMETLSAATAASVSKDYVDTQYTFRGVVHVPTPALVPPLFLISRQRRRRRHGASYLMPAVIVTLRTTSIRPISHSLFCVLRSDTADVRQFLVGKYAVLQHIKLVDRRCVQEQVKMGLVEPLMRKVKQEVLQRISDASTEKDYLSLEEQIATVFDVHAGIESSAKEENDLKSLLNPVQPVKRMLIDRPGREGPFAGQPLGPRRGDYVYDVPLDLQLKTLLESDDTLLEVALSRSLILLISTIPSL